jgi:hypothetical protein
MNKHPYDSEISISDSTLLVDTIVSLPTGMVGYKVAQAVSGKVGNNEYTKTKLP